VYTTNYTCYGIRKCELLIPVDVVVVTTYVNVHRCQEDDGRVQVLMVERSSSLKLRNKQRIHYNGSDQYQKLLHDVSRCTGIFVQRIKAISNEKKQKSKESVILIEKEQYYSCYMRFGATLMCGTISLYVTLVVLVAFIKANGEELG
jgi:hypothetical protein